MTDPTTQILSLLTAAKEHGMTLRVTYQSERRDEPESYFGPIESVGMSTIHACPLFRLRTSEGVRTFLCNERLKGIVPADMLVEPAKPEPKARARSLRVDSGFSKREARALRGMIAP
ncbi:MAG TPA: hypothetical protein VFB99_20450 [Vicinamibacterales bacterium]|nr:hypothetical protein [Vicinamibacterales bacterium]